MSNLIPETKMIIRHLCAIYRYTCQKGYKRTDTAEDEDRKSGEQEKILPHFDMYFQINYINNLPLFWTADISLTDPWQGVLACFKNCVHGLMMYEKMTKEYQLCKFVNILNRVCPS